MLSERGSASSSVYHPVGSAFRPDQTLLVRGGGYVLIGGFGNLLPESYGH